MEEKTESMVLATEPCPDCGSSKHKSCDRFRPPVCGEDFCDACGDCLYCYAEDTCAVTGDHH
jgi:hypothetical protein